MDFLEQDCTEIRNHVSKGIYPDWGTDQAYVVRNQLAEVFEQAGAYRTQFIASDQHCDAGREIGGHGQYIEKVIINATCRIEFKIREQGVDAAIRGKSVAFDVHSGKCYSTDIQQRYLPKDCQGQ